MDELQKSIAETDYMPQAYVSRLKVMDIRGDENTWKKIAKSWYLVFHTKL